MNNVVEALSRLILKYYESIKAGGVDCRIAVPGLSESIAEGLHENLRLRGLPSLLVVPQSIAPSQSGARLRAEGLTSLRHGDMIIIAWPGELSRIQDSIVGAGGTIRNLAFSDEWPWVDESSEYFQFHGPFVSELLVIWQAPATDEQWFRTVISDIEKSARASIERATLVLDDILATFSPILYPDLVSLREKFLFHAGIPRPSEPEAPAAWDAGELHRDMLAISKVVNAARLDVTMRDDVLERLEDIEPDELAQADLRRHVLELLDGLASHSEHQYGGVLTLRGCWGADSARWSSLTTKVLRKLFDSTAAVDNVTFAATVSSILPPTRLPQLVSGDNKRAIVFEGGLLEFRVEYSGLDPQKVSGAHIRVMQGVTELRSRNCQLTQDVIVDDIPYDTIFGRAARKRRVKIQLVVEGTVVAEHWLTVFPCGERSSLLVVLTPGFDVYEAVQSAEDEDASEEVIEVSEPISMMAVVHGPTQELAIQVDDNLLVGVADQEASQIVRLPAQHDRLDPSTEPSGRIECKVSLESAAVNLVLEASDYDRGDFTLEREFILRLAEGGSTAKINRLISIFAGTSNEPYAGLGGLNDKTRARALYAGLFEDPNFQGLPILADLFALSASATVQPCRSIVACGPIVVGGLANVSPRPSVQELISNYQAARADVIHCVSSDEFYRSDKRWPKYAWFPTYVEKRRSGLEQAIVRYLECYIAILDFLFTSADTVTWEECFVLSFLDSVVHWSNDALSAKAVLIGPWHPIIVAKRFMVQAGLLASAQRFRRSGAGFNRLAILFDRVNSLRWIHLLNSDATSFEHGYVSSTSDPGWLLVVGGGSLGDNNLEQLVSSIRTALGLEVSLLPFAREQMASSYLKDFHNAYPSRRSISLSASANYSGERLVESAVSVLYDGELVSSAGRLLPGGVHLFLDDAVPLSPIPWRTPPVCIYSLSAESTWREAHRDIYLLPPGRPKLTRIPGEEHRLARGAGDMAAFYAPVRKITVGARNVPNSLAFERDIEARPGLTVGDTFVRAVYQAGRLAGNPPYAGWSIELPENLSFLWNVVQGGQIDPAVLVKYVKLGFEAGEARVLWDYNMSLTGATNSYFVLSQVPPGVAIALNGSPVLGGRDVAGEIIRELAQVGLAIGSESLRSGSKALGVIGVVAAIRLLSGWSGNPGALTNDNHSRGFLLPVDSFKEILGDGLDLGHPTDRRRADLIAVQLVLKPADRLCMSFAAVECKYTSYTLSEDAANNAIEQAGRTYDRVLALAEAAQSSTGVPERLALLELISFGLRLRPTSDDATLSVEQMMLQHLLDGEFEITPPLQTSIAVITECQGQSARWTASGGLIVRVAPGHWPGIADSDALSLVAAQVSLLFRRAHRDSSEEMVRSPAPPSESPAARPSDISVVQPQSVEAPPTPIAGGFERLAAIVLGADHERRLVRFDPQSEQRPLDNYNMMITGSSGKGKTQLVKALVAELRRQHRRVLMLDFKNDFASDGVFLALSQLHCRYVTFDGLPYNPLIPVPVTHPGTGERVFQISQHITGITSTLAKTFGLGAQQEASLKEIIRECYRDRGLDPSGNIPCREDADFPDFNDVGERLRTSNPAAYNRMDPLFDLGVFSSACRRTNFENVLQSSTVIDLSQIQSDAIKNAIAKILILSAHAYYNARPHTGILNQFFVFDEAHRVLDAEFLARFVRECRAYGVGVLLSSQNPMDFPEEISASLNTKILHGNGAERERVRDIIRTVGGALDEAEVARMGLFDALISNPHYHATKFRTLPYPYYLVLVALRQANEISRRELRVEGIVTERLSLDYIIDGLIAMGLAQEDNGLLRPRGLSS